MSKLSKSQPQDLGARPGGDGVVIAGGADGTEIFEVLKFCRADNRAKNARPSSPSFVVSCIGLQRLSVACLEPKLAQEF